MPFTFSHPAIVLPGYYLPQRWRSLTGLVAGSVAPDFEMFLKMKAQVSFSHTWHSIFWFNLPLALVLCFLFHLIVRNPLINHLPPFLKQRLIRFKSFAWARHFREHTLVVIISILIGIASHIFWDHFTHQYGVFLHWFPVLAEEVALGEHHIPLYFLLQLGFSVVGGLGVLYAILLLPVTSEDNSNYQINYSYKTLRYWLLIIAITLFTTAIRFSTGLDFSYIPNTVVVLISGGLLSLLITPSLIRDK
ncbi:DUF4184 family protein [Pontibacter pamirensis]|uniref:DUF4184 family protein n=1 Tax=Pontibacter pamirensis TaxID=2562824 RepID=UPI00138A3EE5|nr:DUF4184 family protein [Pontibacter pamirensis]